MSIKQAKATPEYKAFRLELVALIDRQGSHLRPDEMLALAAYMVGQMVALQDQTKMTPAQAMELVSANIELGNHEAVAALGAMPTAGRA